MRSTKKLVRFDGSEEWLPAKCEGVDVKEGDVLYFNTWGGGGWGDPFTRDPSLVEYDCLRGLVSSEGAKRYGVVLENGKVNEEETKNLRDKLITKIFCFLLIDFTIFKNDSISFRTFG